MDGDTGDEPRGVLSSAASQSRIRGQNKTIAEQYLPIDKMLNVIDKLNILNYQKDFLKLTKLPRLHRLYFSFPTNPGEQYYNFVTLSAWLLQKCGRSMVIPKETDDPNEVITAILNHIRDMGGVIDFPHSQIKSGSGPDVVSVLDFLTDKALHGHKFLPPKFPTKPLVTIERDNYEVDMSKIEQEMSTKYTEENYGLADLIGSGLIGMVPKNEKPIPEEQKKIVTEIPAEEWRMEVERVLPQLSIPVVDDTYDWTKRQVQLKTLSEQVVAVIDQSRAPLKKLATDIHESIEKLTAREATLSKHAEISLSELAATQDKVSKLRDKQKGLNAEIIEKNKELARLSDDVEASRKKLDERGSVMADGAPVTQARKDLAALKQEISNMDVEVGVMEHYILKSMVQEQAAFRAKN